MTGLCVWPRGFWFRVRGYGLRVAYGTLPLFSERYGYRRVLRVGPFAVEVLKP